MNVEKTYDTVDKSSLIKLLRHIRVDRKVVDILRQLYEYNMVKYTLVQVEGKVTLEYGRAV